MKMSKFAGTCSVEEAIWDVRIHFDALHNLDRKICSSDVTFLNLYALLHTQGFTFSDELYHMENTCIGEQREHGLDLIDTNIKLQQIKKQHEHTLVLNLLVRATATDSAAIQKMLNYRPFFMHHQLCMISVSQLCLLLMTKGLFLIVRAVVVPMLKLVVFAHKRAKI